MVGTGRVFSEGDLTFCMCLLYSSSLRCRCKAVSWAIPLVWGESRKRPLRWAANVQRLFGETTVRFLRKPSCPAPVVVVRAVSRSHGEGPAGCRVAPPAAGVTRGPESFTKFRAGRLIADAATAVGPSAPRHTDCSSLSLRRVRKGVYHLQGIGGAPCQPSASGGESATTGAATASASGSTTIIRTEFQFERRGGGVPVPRVYEVLPNKDWVERAPAEGPQGAIQREPSSYQEKHALERGGIPHCCRN